MAWSSAAREGPCNYLRMHYMHAQVIASRGCWADRPTGRPADRPADQRAGGSMGRWAAGGPVDYEESPHTAYATASLLRSSAVPSMFDSVSQAEW